MKYPLSPPLLFFPSPRNVLMAEVDKKNIAWLYVTYCMLVLSEIDIEKNLE